MTKRPAEGVESRGTGRERDREACLSSKCGAKDCKAWWKIRVSVFAAGGAQQCVKGR